jgi:UDP-N-acetylmuramate--alanine ligase
VIAKEKIPGWIENDYAKDINKQVGQVLITAGAGDIDTLVQPIKEIIEKV